MIRKGDKFKDCSTDMTYRVEKLGEDLIILTALNGVRSISLHVTPRDPLKTPPLQQMSKKSLTLRSNWNIHKNLEGRITTENS